MSEVRLTGLAADHPLGFLAAVGVLRCCGDLPGFACARLSWRDENGWRAVLHLPGAAGQDDLVAALVGRAAHRASARELNWSDSPRVSVEQYHRVAQEAEMEWANGSSVLADYLVSSATEVVEPGEDVATTAFLMTSGRQLFLKECRGVSAALGTGCRLGRRTKLPAEVFRETLFGRWRYEDPVHSLGWDPTTERLHALRGRSPTKEESRGVVGAVGLGFEALPFFPCFVTGGRAKTTGYHRRGNGRGRVTTFTWPVWTPPLSAVTVRSVLSLAELGEDLPSASRLRARGIEAVFRSERYKQPTQGAYYILRPPTRLV